MTPSAGRVRAVIFDWAGTLVDHGSRAPLEAFRETFRRRGVEASATVTRAPMGLAKRDHLAAMLQAEEIRSQWRRAIGRDPSPQDLDMLYDELLEVQLAVLPRHADPIPGAVELLRALRGQGIAVGSTTGYARAMMEVLEPLAARQGLILDCTVCADEVPEGRPKPWMLFAAAQALDVYPPRAAVAVDDTAAGVEAGRNAGMWSVGVAKTGNGVGLSAEETDALEPEALAGLLSRARRELEGAGAHFVIDSVAELPDVLKRIEERLARRTDLDF